MKSLKIHFAILVSLLVLLTLACSKSATTIALPANRFTWIYKSTTHNASQFSAFLYSRGNFVIIGAQGNTITSFPQCNFSITSFSKGSYAINSAGLNILKYVDETGTTYNASTGQVNITAYGSDLISGDFSAILQTSSGTSTPISGTFLSVPVVP